MFVFRNKGEQLFGAVNLLSIFLFRENNGLKSSIPRVGCESLENLSMFGPGVNVQFLVLSLRCTYRLYPCSVQILCLFLPLVEYSSVILPHQIPPIISIPSEALFLL